MAETFPAITMFNAYVANLNTTLGWNGQGGSMQLTLAEDPKTNMIIPKDDNGNPFTGSDPNSPKVGSAVYFKYNNFYFGGIFQKWTYSEDNSSGRLYTINIEAPTKLMDGVQLIAGDFNGMTDYYGSQNWQPQVFEDYPDGPGFYSTNLNSNGTVSTGLGDPPSSFMNYAWIKNIYNVFAFYENAIDGNFGNSRRNELGMPCNAIMFALDILGQRNYVDPITGEGQGLSGPLMFADTEYSFISKSLKDRVDAAWKPVTFGGYDPFGKKIFNIPEAYRISNEYLTVNAFVQELAEVLQFDYYYEVRHSNFDEDAPVKDQYEDGGGIIEEADIVIRTVNKGVPPTKNAIRDYIADSKDKGEKVANYEIGEEFSDATTQKVVIGGPRERYNLAGTPYMHPIWGKGHQMFNGSLIGGGEYADYGSCQEIFGDGAAYQKSPESWYITVDIPLPAEDTLLWKYFGNRAGVPKGYYRASIFEIRMARGDRTNWDLYKVFDTASSGYLTWQGRRRIEPNGYGNKYTAPWVASLDPSTEIIDYLFSDVVGGNSLSILTNTSRALRSNAIYFKELQDVCNQLWELVSNVAKEYYCKKFAIPMMADSFEVLTPQYGGNPQRIAYYPDGEFKVKHSWDVSSSAWLQHKIAQEWQFVDNQGKQLPMAIWNNTQEFSYGGLGNTWSKGAGEMIGKICSNGVSLGEQYFKRSPYEPLTQTNPNTDPAVEAVKQAVSWVVMDTGATTDHFDMYTTADWGLAWFGKYFWNNFIDPYKYLMTQHKNLQITIPPDVAIPFALGVPQVSNRYNYGPWVGGVSFKGKAEIESRKELGPQQFGSWDALNQVGVSYALFGSADTTMTTNETGTMKVVGAPEGNVGQRFASTGPYITNVQINADPNGGVTTTYQFNTWTPSFGKLARYNIERLAKIRSNLFTAIRESQVEKEKLKHALPSRTLEGMKLPENTTGGDDGNLTKASTSGWDHDTIQGTMSTPGGQFGPPAGGGGGGGDGDQPADGGAKVTSDQPGANPVNNNMNVTAMPWFNPDVDESFNFEEEG